MTNQEMVAALKGSDVEKIALFDFFLAKMAGGEVLDDNEEPIFETLKKMLIKPPSVVVDMSATVAGVGGVQV